MIAMSEDESVGIKRTWCHLISCGLGEQRCSSAVAVLSAQCRAIVLVLVLSCRAQVAQCAPPCATP